ncbi:Protein SDA1 homolog (SDA1 domain-containing protein 1 homolog) [Durusdinium trenchii]|uniref:Protein SDA1 n=1 Tax=Durusdinium trenchii TaxID=1381693 RepID=A0ABP0HKT4_9DINO
MEMFKLKPQKPSSSFSEQVMFLAHVAPSFPDKAKALPDLLIGALSDHFEVMHSSMRTTLVQALILLRNRDQFPCSKTLPVYFKLFRSQDKALRKSIFNHIVRDIAHMNQKKRNQKVNYELRDFFFAQMKETGTEICRHACAVFITMWPGSVWSDAHVVNLMSSGLLHPDLKVAAALAHLFLGNKTKGLEGILDESDDEDEADNINEAVTGIVGAKKTGNRVRKLKRAKKAAKKAAKKGKNNTNVVSFVAIDLLNDPQTLSERRHDGSSQLSAPVAENARSREATVAVSAGLRLPPAMDGETVELLLVLSPDDFKKLRKLRLQKSIEPLWRTKAERLARARPLDKRLVHQSGLRAPSHNQKA